MSDFDLNFVTASISPSIQDVQELYALSPPSAGRYALGDKQPEILCIHIRQGTTRKGIWNGIWNLESGIEYSDIIFERKAERMHKKELN